MPISLNRNQFVAKKLGVLNGETVLDIGCRDMIFKKYLQGNFKYTGLDFQKNDSQVNSNFINCNLENGLPDDLEKHDIINALDVLEHLENIHYVFKELFKHSNKKIVIALPNIGYYRFRFSFLFKAIISKKYTFNENITEDRHRWMPNYVSIQKFIEKNLDHNWEYKKHNYIFERRRNFIFFHLEKILSYLLPGLFVYEVIYFFNKKK